MHSPDVCIAGAGIIGITLALELERCGARVAILERDTPLTHASQAAAGMLAARDPDNPPALRPLAELSLSLYPAFLAQIERLSGQRVPFQTEGTFQSIELPAANTPAGNLPASVHPGTHTFIRLTEHSLDPRQLAPALLAAVQATNIRVLEHTTLRSVTSSSTGINLETTAGRVHTGTLVTTQGAWSPRPRRPPPRPDALRPYPSGPPARLRPPHPGNLYRSAPLRPPRRNRRHRGHSRRCRLLHPNRRAQPPIPATRRAAALIPALAACTIVESWAGLRPYTPDHLPILGATAPHRYTATGHFRNGILLAPATARVMAQLLAGETSSIDLGPLFPHRFESPPQLRTDSPIFAHAK